MEEVSRNPFQGTFLVPRNDCFPLGLSEIDVALGDPNFPRLFEQMKQENSILWVQDLYGIYSRMDLSQPSDRPMAIDGIQDRILSALDADGGYGILDKGQKSGNRHGFLRRSLLWRRAYDTQKLSRIQFPSDDAIAKVPSWSWMAYTGGIDYISPPFGDVDWEDLKSPWSSNLVPFDGRLRTEDRGGNVNLIAKARYYNSLDASDGQVEIVLDCPGGSQPLATKAVVLGVQKGEAPLKYRTHYLLIIAESAARDRDGTKIYERVGAGLLPGRCISGEEITVKIQ